MGQTLQAGIGIDWNVYSAEITVQILEIAGAGYHGGVIGSV